MANTVTILNQTALMPVLPEIRVLAESDPADNIKIAKVKVYLAGSGTPLQYNGNDATLIAYAVTGGTYDQFSFDIGSIVRSYFESQNDNGEIPASFVGQTTTAIVGEESTAVFAAFDVKVSFYDLVDGGGFDEQHFVEEVSVDDQVFFNGLWAWQALPPSVMLDIQTDPSYTCLTMRPFNSKTLINGYEFLHFWNHENPLEINAFRITARRNGVSIYQQTVVHNLTVEALCYLAVGYNAIRSGYTVGGNIVSVATTGTTGTALTDWDIQLGNWVGSTSTFTATGTKYTFTAETPCADYMRLLFTDRYGVQDGITMSQKWVQSRDTQRQFFERELPTNEIRKPYHYGRGMTGGVETQRYKVNYLCPDDEREWLADLLNSSKVFWSTTAQGTTDLVPIVILRDSIYWGDSVNGYADIEFEVIVSPTNPHP